MNRLAFRVLLIVLIAAGSAWPQAPTRLLTTIDALIASGLRAVFEDSSVSEIFGGANQV